MPPSKKEKNPLYKSNKDYAYEQWKKSLPENLREESPYYNLRGAWEAGLEPEMFYKDEEGNFRTAHKPHPFNPKYEPHLSSRNPYTGEILKDPRHDTYDMAIEGDIKMGYHPTIDLKTGKMYSISPNDSPTKGPFKNFYANKENKKNRDGKTLEEVFPNRYGDKIKVKNKTPDEYLEESKLIKKPIVKPAKPINKSVQPINKPIKPSNKKLEDNDSWLENIVEFVDPTGVTSYDDVYRSYKNTGLSGETALEALGALPFVGKIGKSGKIISGGFGLLQDTVKAAQYLPSKQQKQVVDKAFDLYQKYSKSGGKEFDELLGSSTKFIKDNVNLLNPEMVKSSDKLINAYNTTFKTGKAYDAYQAATGSKNNSGLKRTDDGVQYNGRNIMPNVANENMYKFGGNIYANGGSSIEAKRDATLAVGNQPKPSFKENKKNPVKDISKDVLPLPGFRDKPEDTELIKLIKERQIKPRGPKQPYELASGAVTPTASPIDAAVVGVAGIPQLVGRGVAGALPYLDAPLTVGSKVLPSVTANNLLNAAGAAYSGEQIINPESELRTNPNAENILMTGLGLAGLPYKAAGLSFADDLGQVGKYLTEETALKNTYKYNPWAFKPQQGKIYRQVGKPGFDDAIIESKIYDKGQKEFLEKYPNTNYLDEYNEAIKAKGLYLKKPSPAPFFSKDKLFFPINRKATGKGFKKTANSDSEYLIEGSVPDEALLPRYMDKYLKPGEKTNTFVLRPEYNDLSNFNIYKRNWLRGYKPIKVSKPTSSFKSEIDWGKWNPETPKYPELINEYNAIEESTKKAGTWMKNPDGSPFQGTPEQFIQQQSSWFKKAFGESKLLNPDGSPIFLYHGSAKKFDTFDPSKFQLGDAGSSGSGIYTVPNKKIADSYALSSSSIHSGNKIPTVYQLYGKGVNPISSEEIIKNTGAGYPNRFESNQAVDLFNFHRKSAPKHEQLLDYDVAIHNQQRGIEKIRDWNDAWEIVFPTNRQLKSAVGNVGFFDMTNPNIYKGLIPPAAIIGAAASQKQEYKYGGNIPMKLNKYNYGGNMYPDGGNTLYVDNPNDPRLQAYKDSLDAYMYPKFVAGPQKPDYIDSKGRERRANINPNNPIPFNEFRRINDISNYSTNPVDYKIDNMLPIAIRPTFTVKESSYMLPSPFFKKPVRKVELTKLDKMLPINRSIDNNSNNIIDSVLRPTQEVTTPKVFVDEYAGNYNNPNIPKGRIKYGKGKTEEFAYGGNMYFPYGGASILTQSNLETGEAQAKENTVLDKDKKTRDTKPVISNPSLYSGKQKQVDTAGTISNIGSDISKEVNKYTYKPISTTPINYNSQIDLKIDNKTNTFSESLAPEIKTNIEAPKVDTYQMSTETDLPAPSPTVTLEQFGQGPAKKTSSFGSKAASNAGGSTATALNIGNQIYNATKNVDDRYNQDLAGNEKYNKEYSQAQEKYKEDQSIVDTTATTLGTIGTVMSAIPVVNAFSWIPALLAAGTKAIGDPIVDADYENNAREASLRNFNMASPEEYNRSMKVSNKNILAPESNQARYGGKMFSYGGNIYANGGMTMYNMPKGLTHEQHPYGGYPIGNNNYVESDEVVLDKPDGSKYIFSNRIKYKR